jgi:hypothetical protein
MWFLLLVNDTRLCAALQRDANDPPARPEKSSFRQLIDGLDEIVARLRFEEDAVHFSLEVARRGPPKK